MAVLAAAALLDELMGRNRNIAPNDKAKELNWEDPEYCKLYMVKFCPHDLFVNTRADLGQCPKVHDDEAKALFEKSNSYKKQQYEDEFIRFCQSMLNEVERKIVKGKQRLALIGKADAISLSPAQTQKNEEQIKFLTEKINSLVGEAEQMGIQGNVEQAQGLMKLCDQLKEEREQLRGNNENKLAAAQEKQMEVCDVCGAFLIVGDAQQRIDDHLMGKQHVGYARLKMAMEELIVRSRSPRSYRHRSGSRSRSRTRKGSRDKDYLKRSGKGCDDKGKSTHSSRSKSRDRNRDFRRKSDDHDKDHHRKSNKERGLNGDYGRHSSPSHRSSNRHHQDSKFGKGSSGGDGGRGDD
ncbi:hypothetical protein L9F63_023571 [Diploptera punctata]|uniref:Luc7-like protein 3 n=1 Tax=Diploptera punctata TaxID=6984 RepID=A0AAD8E8J6_DIPPU|nr:hypothetical protein L9F63_023571 [Diploptera punctata]